MAQFQLYIVTLVCNFATFLLFNCIKFLQVFYSRVFFYCHFYDLWYLF